MTGYTSLSEAVTAERVVVVAMAMWASLNAAMTLGKIIASSAFGGYS